MEDLWEKPLTFAVKYALGYLNAAAAVRDPSIIFLNMDTAY